MKMIYDNGYSGRLFLAKGEQDIYVDVEQIPQQQIEGIRFLYKQFKKEKSGVIVNDHAGCGTGHQVVLFLKAIKSLLRKPILILCKDHQKSHWLTYFQELTDFGDGVLLEPPNLNIRRMSVCIDTMSNMASLMKRDWSVMIIDDNNIDNIATLKKKGVFKSEFKIWMTSVDMKTNMKQFWDIFTWLCPKEGEEIKEIVLKIEDSTEKLIILDAVMENVVLRRANAITPLMKQTKVTGNANKVSNEKDDGLSTKTKSKSKNSCISNVYNILENVNDNYEKSDSENVEMKQIVDDPNNVWTGKTSPEKFIHNTKINNLESKDCLSIKYNDTENHKNTNCEVYNDVPNKVQDVEMANDEISKITTEQNVFLEQGLEEINNLKVSHNFEEIDLSIDRDRNKERANITNVQSPCEKIKQSKNETSSHKNIDEVMRESEEKALKKFKGSLLDNIF